MNGISEKFFKVSTSSADKVEYLLEHEKECLEQFPSFYEKMRKGYFIVDNDQVDESLLTKKFTDVKHPEIFRLMILPTYQCNLRCWYCTQDHENYFMSKEIINRIKKLIDRELKRDDIKHLTLSWFGGEPMLCYDTVITLTEYAKNKCAELGKTFSSDMTSNSTLMDADKIATLISLGVRSYQITIDGPKKIHDKIKRLNEYSAFKRAMENIEILATSNVHCGVRFNYTHKNLKPDAIIADLKSHLSSKALKNCTFMLYKVWQEDAKTISEKDVSSLFNQARKIGMITRFASLGLCYADYRNFCCVFPNGKVSKCDNDNPKNITSELNADGTIEWSKQVSDVREITPGDNSACSICQFYPICWGPCIGKRQNMVSFDKCAYREGLIAEMLIKQCRSLDPDSI